MITESYFQPFRHIRHCITLGLIVVLALWAAAASAADALYTARVEVADRSTGERSQAMNRALRVVLLKVTGDRDAARRAASSPAFRTPENFVQQYRYVSDRQTEPENKPELWFEVRFDKQALDNVLRSEGLQLWGQERPSVLVWLAVQESGRRYLASGNESDEVTDALHGAARQRGLPLLFPLHDVQDQSRVKFADVWGGFHRQVMAASDRYQASAVLYGRLEKRTGNYWRGGWTLDFAGKRSSWDTDGRTPAEAIGLAIDQVADWVAAQLAIRSSADGSARITVIVEGVQSLSDYARATGYLQSLTAVRDISVRDITGDRVGFSLGLQGSEHTLDRAVSVGRVLRPLSTEPQRIYQLVP